mmetsp:Transcript_17387/g.43305  ORF Transcript_17387/g.43305 Transcript_17387/m.43305 type:complete len:92 (+) Transcript_17387:109-384(+)
MCGRLSCTRRGSVDIAKRKKPKQFKSSKKTRGKRKKTKWWRKGRRKERQHPDLRCFSHSLCQHEAREHVAPRPSPFSFINPPIFRGSRFPG